MSCCYRTAWEHPSPSTQQKEPNSLIHRPALRHGVRVPAGRPEVTPAAQGHPGSLCIGSGPEWGDTLASWLLQVHAPYICEPLCELPVSFLLWCNYEVNCLKSVKVKTDKPGELKSDFTFISLSWPFLHAANGSHGLCGVLLVVGFLPAVLHGGLCLLLWFQQKWSQILYAGSCLPLENKIWNHS